MLKHTKKVAVVTGGTGSLGQIVIARLNNEGYKVIVPYRNSVNSQVVVNKLQQQYPYIDFQIANIESEHSVKKLFSYIFDKYEQIDILCNLVGGITEKKWVEEISFDEWKMMMGLNLDSCFLMVQAAVGGMKKNRFGRIITIGAMPALHPESRRSSYTVSKAGVIALTRSVAMEIKQFGDITANAIVPSIIVTEENKKWGSDEEIKKWITPDEIADMILYLISDSGRGINGQALEMYGKV
jgi:NAD(P)-dependent dehydrogenase (short-subunit alcohol dehydrogenase family)